jgi:surface antigen
MSKSPRVLSGIAAVLLLAFGANAQAANLGFLHDTPASWMKQADYDSLTHAVRDAVANKADGESSTWNNDGLRNSVKIDATITPTKTEKDGNKTCRDTDVVVNAKGQTMTLRPQFCREGEGQWIYQKRH